MHHNLPDGLLPPVKESQLLQGIHQTGVQERLCAQSPLHLLLPVLPLIQKYSLLSTLHDPLLDRPLPIHHYQAALCLQESGASRGHNHIKPPIAHGPEEQNRNLHGGVHFPVGRHHRQTHHCVHHHALLVCQLPQTQIPAV